MFKELLTFFTKESKLDEAFRLSHEMFEITRAMFLCAKRSLREQRINQSETCLYRLDRKINKLERRVRRYLLQHLTVSGQEGVASGLKLVSIISDIERVREYNKNIFGISEDRLDRLHAGDNEADLKRFESSVEEAFFRIRAVLETGSQDAARTSLKDFIWLNPMCDQRLNELIKDTKQSVSPRDAVALSLYYRYLKQIHSRLGNIATNVSGPFHQIGSISKQVRRLAWCEGIDFNGLNNSAGSDN